MQCLKPHLSTRNTFRKKNWNNPTGLEGQCRVGLWDIAAVPPAIGSCAHRHRALLQTHFAGNCLKGRFERARSLFPSDLKRKERKNPIREWGRGQGRQGLGCAPTLALRSAAVLWDSDDLGYSASWILSRLMLRNTKAFCPSWGGFWVQGVGAVLVVRLLPFSVGSSMPSVQICVPVLCSLGEQPHSINISTDAASCGPHILKFCDICFRFWTYLCT